MSKIFFAIFSALTFMLFTSLLMPQKKAQENLKVLFLNPFDEYTPIWKEIEQGMTVAAQKKNIELKVFYANNEGDRLINKLKSLINGNEKPDYIMLTNFRKMGAEILSLLKDTGIKVYFIKDAFSMQDGEEQFKREYPNWIGTLLVDHKHINDCIINKLQTSNKYEETVFLFSSIRNNFSTAVTEDFKNRANAEVNINYFIDRNVHNVIAKNPEIVINRLLQRDKKLTSIIIDDYNVANQICSILKNTERKIAVNVCSYDSSLDTHIKENALLMAFAGYNAFGQIAINQLFYHKGNSEDFKKEIKVQLIKIDKNNIDEMSEHLRNNDIGDKFIDRGQSNGANIFSFAN